MFRRSVTFTPETRRGVRDKKTFDALLAFIEQLLASDSQTARTYLRYLLIGFAKLRDTAAIEIRRVARLSMEQLSPLVAGLLVTPRGGLIPVLLSVAMFRTLRDCYDLDWDIEQQGINVSDRASGAGGDITIRRNGQVLMAIEVTERPIGRARIVSTFNTKISPNGLNDYLFIFSAAPPTDDAKEQAGRYFAAGHEINFVAVQDWIVTTLTTIGQRCRARFTANFINLLTEMAVPAAIKVAWNSQVVAIVG
jgi:hypothetical protein